MNDMPVFGPDQVSTKTALEDIAIETGTPIEVLFAAGEQAEAKTPEEFLNIARQRGQQLGPRFKAGEDPIAIVAEVFGPEAQRSFGDYATEIRAQLYGTPTVQQRNQAEIDNEGIGGLLKRRGQQFVRGVTEPFAAMPEAAAIAQAQTDGADTPAADLEGFARGQAMRDSVANTFGAPNPEDRSFWGMVAEGAGNLVGMGGASLAAGVAGTMVGGPVGGTVAGLTTGAGIGAAMNTSQLYREARDAGADEATAERAARWGAVIGASEIVPIARAFKYLPQGVRQRVGNGVMKRFADIAQSAGEEAAQEYLATVANNMVAQQLYDPDRRWTENATESALVGAVLGAGAGGIGAGVDAYRNRQQPQPLPEDPANPNTGQGNPSAPPGGAPQPGMVPPVAAPGQEPEQGVPTPTADVLRPQAVDPLDPAGQRPAAPSPVSDVLAGAPQPALGGFKANQPVQIQLVDPETGELSDPIEATFVGEDPAQGYASFRGPDGSPAEIDLADIASGNVIVSPAVPEAQAATQPQEQPIVPPVQEAAQQPAQPAAGAMPPIPAGVDPDAFMERVAVRQADGMSPEEAYQLTLQDTLEAMRQDVGVIADDVQERERQAREEQSRIDEAVFTDDRGQPVVFPTEAVALGRLGAGYSIEPFGEGFIGVRQQEAAGNEGNANDSVGGDGSPVDGGGNIASGGDADRAPVAGGRDGAELGPVEQGPAQGVADATGAPDVDTALKPSPVDDGAAADPVANAGQEPVKQIATPEQEVTPDQSEIAPADQETDPIRAAVRDAIAAGPIQHTTAKGKVLDGYILKGMKPAQVKEAFDTGAFPKDGGTFIRKDRAEKFLGDAQAAAPSEINQKAVAKISAALKPDNKDGLGYYVSGSDSFQIDALGDGDAEITITNSKSRYEGRAKVTSENSQRVKYSDVRDSLSPEARAAIEEVLAFDPDAEPAAAKAEAPVRQRPAIGSPEYTLIDARNDLIDMQTEEASQGMIGDGRLLSRIERQKALIKRMEQEADDLAAKIEAAAAETDPNPTEAQKEAENYKTGKTKWNGLNLSIENAKGSERSKKTPDGKTQWSVTMPAHYGRILRTEGADGDHVDFYMGDVPDSDYVLIINQVDPETQKMDEHKVIIGTTARGAALGIYRDGFSDGSGNSRIGSFTETNVANLKAWLASGETKTPTQPIDMPFAKRKAETKNPTQGTSSLPGGVPDGETRAEDQGAAKIMLRRARVLAGEINDTEAFRKFMVDSRKPVSEQLVQEAENYIRDNQKSSSRKSLTWADFDERSDNDPKMPEGYELTVIRRMTKEEAEAEGYQWPAYKAVVKRDKPAGTYKVESGISENSRANAIAVALERAKQGAERTDAPQQPQNNPDEMSADDILNAAFDDVFGAAPETTSEPKPDMFEGNETEARKQGRKDFARDMPRRLPSYIDPTDAAAANGWYAGWDEANAADPVPGVTEGATLAELPDQDPGTAWDSASDGERASVFTATGWALKNGNGLKEAAQRNINRDWKDLTPAAQDKVRQAIEQGMLIGDYADQERARRESPQPKPRTASEAAKSAASNTAEGINNIVDGLNALFGGANKLSSGLTFDAETYAKAKPMFIAAVRAFGRAGQDIMDMARAMVRGLSANGLTQEAQENMRPYLTQFINDMRDGTVDPFAEDVQAPAEGGNVQPEQPEATDEQRGNQESDTGEPAPQEDGAGSGERAGNADSEPADDGSGEGYEDGEGADAGDDAGGSLGDGPGSVSDRTGDTRAGTPPPNFVIDDAFPLGEGTEGQKLAANIEALRLVRTLEQENRYATPDEQAVLARWVGWGGLKTVFDDKHAGATTQWGRAQAALKELLTTEEYIAAMRSTNDAHYTSRTVVKAMWRAMRNFGFDGGRALEPTIGSGNFLGLQPADLSAKTEWFAAELDPTTGKIAKHLYPQARVFDGMGFQDAPFKRAAFDVAIGNPPFGATKIGNKKLHPDLGKMSVHNFIIAKTGQLLREGGVMSMVVTHRFLDTANPEARKALAPEFRFLGAIRLPNTAFEANANTQVTTDIVFFQKRREGETDNDTTWLETGVDGPNGTKLNGYFAANPDMILGRPAMDGTMYAGGRQEGGPGEFTVHADGRDLEASLNEAIDRIQATIPPREQALEAATTARENSSTLPYGAMTLTKDGRIFRGEEDEAGNRVVQEVTAESFWKDNAEAQERVVKGLRAVLAAKKGNMPLADRLDLEQRARDAAIDVGLVDLAGDPVKQNTKYETALAENLSNLLLADKPRKDALDALTAYESRVESKRLGTDGFERLSSMLDLRQKTRELIAMERADAEPNKIEATRRRLRDAYRTFQKKYGYLNNSKNEAILRGDVGPELALELGYLPSNKEGRAEAAKEAPILSKRVIYPHKLPDAVESVADGLHVSMQERGFIDPALIGQLTGKTTEEVVKEMTSGAEPLAFRNPKTGRFEIAEVYLSGNLAEKIADAESAGMYQNVPHLKNAMPPPKAQEQITPSIRSLWIPPEVFNDFLRAMGYNRPKVELYEKVGMASVDAGGTAGLTEFGKQFETERMDPARIFEHAIKGKIPVVYDTIRTPDGDKRVKNEEATREAVAAYDRMTREFPEWAYTNPERAGKIVDAFNEKMNVVTERKYQGVRYLRMVGNSPEIDLRNSQKNGAWRMIQDKVALLHHVVGAGKTFTAIAGVMERKRMGLTRKAVVAVPNHLTGQWGREWLELYPAANILVPTEKDFEPANRAKLINRIATGDFDAVIVGHSQLTKIENDPEITTRYIAEQIEELNAAMREAKASGESKRTVGQMGTRLAKLSEKLRKLEEKLAERTDSKVLGWKDLGVDYLVVDEAHLFKNLEYTTTASQLVGMNAPGGSQRAFDMLMKVRTLQAMQGGGVSFLTGTPVSNSLVEIYSMMKYLIPDSLRSMGIQAFDGWKAAFIQDESRFEYTASMQLKERNIMSGMINLGPLSQLYRSFADIVMRPDVERMFTEQMEARNAAEPDPAKRVPTRFPTPKVKGGARRISLAPPTPKMKEFVRYLVMRMAGIKANKSNRDYMSVDNALWVLTDARKASVDIRTIDPTLGREEGSKVDRASAEVFRIWQENAERKGAQMVFSDMSAPTKSAEKDAKSVLKAAYEKLGIRGVALKDRMKAEQGLSYSERWGNVIEDIESLISSPDTDDRKRDSLNEFIESEAAQDASAAMFTADTGFSFYDDMRAALIEKGVPEKEIAFIHDYDTTAKKAQLFDAVNEGNIRVLIGSTQKMGAGTNAQKRLVALHHIDAPWRPSDMEQREGRIIRQGNLFYQQDPEGFEVEIVAYSTEQTADVVQWQVLERKAASIETFLNAAADTVVEEGGDADQYAEFMAQSTGKEVFLQKMQAEKARDTARAEVASTLRNLSEAERFMRDYKGLQELYGARADTFGSFSTDMIGEGADTYLSDWEATAAAYRADKERIEAEREAVRLRNADRARKDWEKLPELPSAPARWDTRPASGWERKVYDVLDRLQSAGVERSEDIAIGGGFKISVFAKAVGGGVMGFRAYLVPPKNGSLNAEVSLIDDWSIEVKDFRRSDKLLNAFAPANIANRAKARGERAAREKQRHADTLPQMQAIQERGVDMSKVEQAEERLARLTALVRIEEVKFASETASAGPNYFAERDDKGRDLIADNTAQPLTGQFQFTNAGQNYASEWGAPDGTRRIDGTDRSGLVAFFEAENMDTREPVVIEAIRTQEGGEGKAEEWSVLNVWDNDPLADMTQEELERLDRALTSLGITGRELDEKDADEMRMDDDGGANAREMRGDAPAADPAFTEDARRAVTRALRDQLAKVLPGKRVSVSLVRELYSLKDGTAIMGRANRDGTVQVSEAFARDGAGAAGILNHEIVHVLRDKGLWRSEYGLFERGEWERLVRKAEADTGIVASVNKRYKDKGLTREEMQEEYVAEMYRLWKGAVDGYGAVERILLKIEDFFRALASAFRGEGFDSAGRIMQRIADGGIGGRDPSGPGRGARSNAASVVPAEMRQSVREQINAAWNGAQQSAPIVLGRFPTVLRALTGKDHPFVVSSAVVRKAGSHGLTLNDVLAAIDGLDDPVMAFDSTNESGNLTVLVDTKAEDGRSMVVAVDAAFKAGRVEISRIATIHGKNNDGSIIGWMRDGYLRYINKRKADAWSRSIGRQLPKDGTTKHRRGIRILQHSDVFKGGAEMRLGRDRDPVVNPSVMASIARLWSPRPAGSAAAMDKKEAGFVSNLLTNAMASNDRYNSLGLVPGEVLFRDMGKSLPSAAKWVKTMRQMTAERQEMHAEADVLAREWQGTYAKDKANGRALHDLMHESTIEQVDPSERFRAPRRPVDMSDAQYMNFVEEKRAKHAELKQKFNALPDNMREIYRKARDAYKAFDAKLIDAMVDAVVKAMGLQADRLKARYEAELQQFRDDGLEGDALKEAQRKARSRYNQDVKMLEFSRNARIRKMRLTYEANRIEGPYFPLMRFGQFFVAARNEKGKLVHFERASTAGAQQRIANEMRDQGLTVETGVMKPEDNMSRFVDPNFVADITESLGEAGADSTILDAIYQRYLETLPSFSIRKANIHRQGVPGFDKDAIKAFGNRMFHGAHQLTRLRHSMDLTKHIENARREAKRASDPVRAGALANEMQKRHDWSMNPQGAEWSAWATSAAFVWYLGLTPAAAMINLSQTTVVGIPLLAAGIQGGTVAKASKALTGALADFTAGLKKGDAEWSRGALTSGRLSEDERRALQAAYLSGALDKSQAHDIAAIGESGAEYSPIREKVMRPIAFLFHHAERLNREVTFLAAYRMAKEAGMDYDEAVKKAGDLTWDTHFNYENWSRPRFMQGDVARVLFTFRQFQVNMLYRLFRDSHQALKGETPEVRKQARAQLIGITASMLAHAGITGTWGYALIMLLAGMFMEGGAEEAEEELKKAIVGTFGAGAGGFLLNGVPGHLTGVDLTSRIGMPELWFRSPDRQLEGKEAYNHWVEQILGPVPAIGASIFRGASMVGDGEVWRGMELMVPKAIRDQLRFVRYLNEGVTTYKGDPLLDDISAHDAIVQAIGFSPARVSERYEQNRRLMNAQTRIEDERRKILSDITRYIRDGQEISPRALRRRDEFNAKYPTFAITGETIRRSYRARLNMSEQMDGGIRINPKLDRHLRENMAPSINN